MESDQSDQTLAHGVIGSTAGVGSASQGSSPCEPAIPNYTRSSTKHKFVDEDGNIFFDYYYYRSSKIFR